MAQPRWSNLMKRSTTFCMALSLGTMMLAALATSTAEAQSNRSDGALTAADRRGMELQEVGLEGRTLVGRRLLPRRKGVETQLAPDPETVGRQRRGNRLGEGEAPRQEPGDRVRPAPAEDGAPDRVEVEWFHSHLDESGQWGVWVQTWLKVKTWENSMLKAGIPVIPRHRAVGKGPTWLRLYNDHRRAYQELIYAWEGEPSWKGQASEVQYHLIQARDRVDRIASRESLEKIVEAAGESAEEWRSLVETERTRERIREADDRFRELMTRAS